MSDVRILATGLGFPEGPVAMPDGSVILTEIRNNRCSRVAPDGKVTQFSANGGGPNGLAVGPDGALYCCNNGGSRYVEGVSMGQGPHPDYKGGSIQRLDRATGAATTFTPNATACLGAQRHRVRQGGAASTSPISAGLAKAPSRPWRRLHALPDGSKIPP
jgi:gluconolactonase